LSLLLSQLHKTSGAQVWRGNAATTVAIGILAFGSTFSWLWFGISAWSLVILAWCASLGERCATLVGYWSASRIILSVKVKVLGVGLCAYGWVTILLYCLWKNEHISLFLTLTGMLREEWEKLKRREMSTIRPCLADLVLLNVSGEDSTKKLWDKLGSFH
jgi:hypothetical protein